MKVDFFEFLVLLGSVGMFFSALFVKSYFFIFSFCLMIFGVFMYKFPDDTFKK